MYYDQISIIVGSLRSDKNFGFYVRSAAWEACIATWVLDAYPAFYVGRGKPRKVLIDMAGRQDQRIHGDLPPPVRH